MRHENDNKVATPTMEEVREAIAARREASAKAYKGRLSRRPETAAFADLARRAVASPLFEVSRNGGSEEERDSIGLDVQDALDTFVRRAAFSLDKGGRKYYDALGQFEDTLTPFVGECIAEALALHGVTDAPTVLETIRCVIKGGRLFDGDGFTKEAEGVTKAESPTPPAEENTARACSILEDAPAPPMTMEQAEAYVKANLPGVNMFDVGGWLAGELRDGRLQDCPVCGFFHRPGQACAVCAKRGESAVHLGEIGLDIAHFEGAASAVVRNREKQVELLHDLSNNDYYGAENLLMAAMFGKVIEARNEGK